MQGEESYIAVPRWMGLGVVSLIIVVALISIVGLVTLGGRVGAVEGRAASTARSVGDTEADLSARIDRLARRIDSARTDRAATGRLGTRIADLAADLAAHRSTDGSKALAASLARLESSVASLKGNVMDAMRMAAKAAEAEATRSAPAAPAVTTGELDRIAQRVAGIEERVKELAKSPARTSSKSSRTQINENAVRKLVEDTVKKQVEAELKAMMGRWGGRGRGGGD
jgi:hypothetical protein